jgi:2-deoxy-D-gluconate 3-dehydrogenase
LGGLAVVSGASGGIGQAIAVGLARAGASLVLAGRDVDRLAQTRDLAEAAGAEVTCVPLDMSDVDSVHAFADLLAGLAVPPRILVNSAGNSITKNAFDVTPQDWDLVHDVHLRGTFFLCQAVGKLMSAQSYGKIVNLSSTWAATVAPGRSVYCAAKAGLSHLTAALAVEWAPLGLRVNAIAPTATRTPRVADRFAADPARELYLRDRIPLGRLALPEDITGAALFLASPVSDFVTGHTLYVDGGWRAAK